MTGISQTVSTVRGKNMTHCIVFGVFILDALPPISVNGGGWGGDGFSILL